MRGLEIQGGTINGFCTRDSHNEAGCWFGLAMSRYAGNVNKWVPSVESPNCHYSYKSECIPAVQLAVEGGYYYKSLADPPRTFFLYLGGSALAGYESMNRGKGRLCGGSTLRHRDYLLYDRAVMPEVSAYPINRTTLSLTGRGRILWGTTTGHFHVQFDLGVKFTIHQTCKWHEKDEKDTGPDGLDRRPGSSTRTL